jgi:hypothetical protein
MYTVTETAAIFDVNRCTVLKMIAVGRNVPRDLPGRARFLAADMEDHSQRASQKKPRAPATTKAHRHPGAER